MLKGKVVKVEDLTVKQAKTIYSIMTSYYDNLSEGDFFADLLKKEDIVLLCDENNSIHGFTTLTIVPFDSNIQLLFSGDTIIEKEYWGKNDLSQVWVENAFKYAERFDGKTYWLLLTKGYKTYKFLPVFFNSFYPRVNTQTPKELQAIIDGFAIKQYGDKYKNGVLVAGKDYLKDEFSEIGETHLKDINTAFFKDKNPNYIRGDELVCLAQLSVDNLNKLGRKMLGR